MTTGTNELPTTTVKGYRHRIMQMPLRKAAPFAHGAFMVLFAVILQYSIPLATVAAVVYVIGVAVLRVEIGRDRQRVRRSDTDS